MKENNINDILGIESVQRQSANEKSTAISSQQGCINSKVVNVPLVGGIIGLLSVSPQNLLNRTIKKENAKGWRVVQIIPAASGNIFLAIFRFIILIITLLLYTPTNGFYVIMEKINGQIDENNLEGKEPDKSEEEIILNGIELTKDEQICVKSFVRHGFKPDERLVMNKKTREITRFDAKEWSKEDQEAWSILMDEGGRVIT